MEVQEGLKHVSFPPCPYVLPASTEYLVSYLLFKCWCILRVRCAVPRILYSSE